MVNDTYVVIEPIFIENQQATLGLNHRLTIYEEIEFDVVFGLDPIWYGSNTSHMRESLSRRYRVNKEEFLKNTLTMRDFNMRWLRSLRDDAH